MTVSLVAFGKALVVGAVLAIAVATLVSVALPLLVERGLVSSTVVLEARGRSVTVATSSAGPVLAWLVGSVSAWGWFR